MSDKPATIRIRIPKPRAAFGGMRTAETEYEETDWPADQPLPIGAEIVKKTGKEN